MLPSISCSKLSYTQSLESSILVMIALDRNAFSIPRFPLEDLDHTHQTALASGCLLIRQARAARAPRTEAVKVAEWLSCS